MQYNTSDDIETLAIQLSIMQFVKYGEPKDLDLLSQYRAYGELIYKDLSEKSKSALLLEIAEAMTNEKFSK